MVSGKYSALSGAITRQQRIDNTSANLANVTTIGYKKAQVSFEAMLRGERQRLDTKGINYNRVRNNYTDFAQGPLKETDNPFDFAIVGDGFFKFRTINGDRLTRNGSFSIGPNGRLENDRGMPILDEGNNQIFIPNGAINRIVADENGQLSSVTPTGERALLARLAVVDVQDRTLLQREADTSFSLKQGAVEAPAQDYRLSQGSLESSNVNMTEEMTKMINDNRLFEAYHHTIKSYSKLSDKMEDLGTLP